jgi:hypothetical protein
VLKKFKKFGCQKVKERRQPPENRRLTSTPHGSLSSPRNRALLSHTHNYPWPLCGSLPPKSVFSTCSHPRISPSEGLRLFLEPNLFTYNFPHSQPQSHFIPTRLLRWNKQSVPKRWHLSYRRREIIQKKA